mmetsp:Transcript_21221/g.63741  ORF Transcript_21221/g.63741 Transcript_21221/m.63741 type:complete len:207 (+) Transcript_21221:679-1299(+)
MDVSAKSTKRQRRVWCVSERNLLEGYCTVTGPSRRSVLSSKTFRMQGGDEVFDSSVLADSLHGCVVRPLQQLYLAREPQDQLVEHHGPGSVSGRRLCAHDHGQGAGSEKEVHEHVEHAREVPRGDERPLHVDTLHGRTLRRPVKVILPVHCLDSHTALKLLPCHVHQHSGSVLADREELLEGPRLREVREAEQDGGERDQRQQRRH